MARAVIPLSEISRQWNIDPRNIRLISNKAQREFLRALHAEK